MSCTARSREREAAWRKFSLPRRPRRAASRDGEEAADLREERPLLLPQAQPLGLLGEPLPGGGKLHLALGQEARDLLGEGGAGGQDPVEGLLRHAPALRLLEGDDGRPPG